MNDIEARGLVWVLICLIFATSMWHIANGAYNRSNYEECLKRLMAHDSNRANYECGKILGIKMKEQK